MNKYLDIIPPPKTCEYTEGGKINIKKVYCDCETTPRISYALDVLGKTFPFSFAEDDSADLIITYDEKYLTEEGKSLFDEKYAEEQGYIIKKEENAPIYIIAKTDIGCLYAVMTLIQLADKDIKSFLITDYPDFKLRGNKWTIWAESGAWSFDFGDGAENIKKRVERLLDLNARYKINAIYMDAFGLSTERFPEYSDIMRFANDKASLAKSGKKSKSGKNLQALQDYYRYRAFFQTAWDVARTRVQQTLSTMAADDPRREVLYSFLSSGGIMNDSPVAVTFDYGNPGSTIRRGTKEAAAAAGYRMENSSQTGSTALSTATLEVRQQLKDVLLENATDKEKAAQEIAAVAMQGLGLEGQAAEDMARDIVEAFYSDLADRAAKRLSRMFSTKQASQKVQNAFAQKLTELYNLGAFSNQDYRKMAFDLLFGKDADIEIPDSLMRQFVEAAEDRKGEALDAIYRSAASQIKATGWEKLNAWRYMAMLGNARTQIRNIGGNLLFRPSVAAKRVIGAGLERIFVKQENRTKAVLGAGKDARELLAWAREDAAGKTGKELLSFSSLTGDNARSKIQDYRRIYNTGWLEQVRRFVQTVPEGADMFFKKWEYSVSLASFLKARGYTAADIADGKVSGEVLEEARAYAAQEAMKATFNDHNMLSDLLSKRLKGDNTFTKAINLAAEGVLPFRRTPANILVRGIEYNPVYLVRGIATAVQSVKNQEITAADAIDQLASSFTGTGMIILGWALASGVFGVRLRGKIEDEDEKAAGHQDYALEIGNTSFTVDWVAPANIPLLIGANIYEASRAEDPDATAISTIIEACGNTLEPMLELSCLSFVNELFESVKYSGDDNSIQTIAATIATSYLSQFIPTVFGQFERAVEKEKTSAYSDADTTMGRSAEKFVGRMAQKIPVGDVFQVKKYDERGEQDEMLTRANGIGQFLGMPSNISAIQEDDIYKEISRLNSAQNTNVSLPKADSSFTFTDKNTVRHENYRLSAKEYETLSQTQGQTQAKLLHELFASSEYAALSDEQKAAAVKDVYNYARETARIAAVEGYPGYQNKWMIGIEDDPTQVIIDRQKDKAQTGQSKIAATGVSTSTAAYVENLLDGIKPETGRSSVRTVQKWEALVDSDELSDSDVEKLLPLYMTGKTPERYKNALDEGFTSEEFVDAYRIYLDREEGTKKTQLIRQMSAELGVPYREAKQLYEIYTEDIA